MPTGTVNATLTERNVQHLQYLLDDTGLSRSDLIRRLIEREYSEALAYPTHVVQPRPTAPVRPPRPIEGISGTGRPCKEGEFRDVLIGLFEKLIEYLKEAGAENNGKEADRDQREEG